MAAPLLTPAEMAEMDRRTIEDLGVPGLVLMESAAAACVHALLTRWADEANSLGVLVVAGPGNNGADGLAIARRLVGLGIEVEVSLATPKDRLGRDAAIQLGLAEAQDVPVYEPGEAPRAEKFGVVIDALFGTGLSREVEGTAALLVADVSTAGRPVLAVDIPSGIDGSTGQVLGVAVPADCTVTFACPKLGHFAEPGRSHRGALLVADIGVPIARFPEVSADAPRLLDAGCLTPLGPATPTAHKGTFGHLLVVAGGPGKVGAARLTCEAALRAGAGLVTLALPEGVPSDSLAQLRPEVMVERVPSSGGVFGPGSLPAVRALAATRGAVALGPGLGTDPATVAFVRALLADLATPCVIDADALNCMSGASWPKGLPRVITPHPGEASRLLGEATTELQRDRVATARALQRRTRCVAVLKGAGTIVAAREGTWLNPSGNPGMGTAGSGDVLTGVTGALLARDLSPDAAATAAVYWHGVAGDSAAAAKGEAGMLASDISEGLGVALRAEATAPTAWFEVSPTGHVAW